MRKLLTAALILISASLSAPAGAFAQSAKSATLATISGESVDAGGRAVASQRVELVQFGSVVNSTTSGSRGEWSFANVTPGDYVLRMTVNGQVAGVRVSATPGEMAKTVIVAPSAAAASPAFLASLGLVWGTITVAAITAAIITTAVIVSGS